MGNAEDIIKGFVSTVILDVSGKVTKEFDSRYSST